MLKFLIFIAIQLGAFSLVRAASCVDDFISETETQTVRLEKKYSALDRSGGGQIAEINRPHILKGSKREVVFLVHGFMGSPQEMTAIAERLNAEGYTTYTGLIPGYGATATVANEYTHQQWSRWYTQEVRRLQQCFSKIHLVGFSTGALLATEYAAKNPQDETIRSVTLLSPYYQVHNAFIGILRLSGTVIVNQVSVDFVFFGMHYPDVEVMVRNREAYLQMVPLKAGQEVVDLGESVRDRKPRGLPSSIPALIFISGDDLVINQDVADEVTDQVFANRQVVFRERGSLLSKRVPHHLMVDTVSPVVRSTENRIVEFFKSL